VAACFQPQAYTTHDRERLTFCIGWDEGVLGTADSSPMTLGEKATLIITAYVWVFTVRILLHLCPAYVPIVITLMVLGELTTRFYIL
jgi:hypothetical protein